MHLNSAILKSNMFSKQLWKTFVVNCQTMLFIKSRNLFFVVWYTYRYAHKHQPTHTHTHAYIFIFIEIANNYSIKADQTAKMQKANNFQDVLDDKVCHFTYLHVYNDTMQTHRTNFPWKCIIINSHFGMYLSSI